MCMAADWGIAAGLTVRSARAQDYHDPFTTCTGFRAASRFPLIFLIVWILPPRLPAFHYGAVDLAARFGVGFLTSSETQGQTEKKTQETQGQTKSNPSRRAAWQWNV